MKTKIILLTLALGASTCLISAQDRDQRPGGQRPDAREGGPGGREGPGGPGGMRGERPPMPIIEALDLNRDGTISADEIAKAVTSLKKLDNNGDGRITPDEYRPPRRGGPGGPGRPDGRGGERRRTGPGGEDRPQRPPFDE